MNLGSALGRAACLLVMAFCADAASAETSPEMRPLARASDTAPWCLADQSFCLAVDSVSDAMLGTRSDQAGPPTLTISLPRRLAPRTGAPRSGAPESRAATLVLPFDIADREWVTVWPVVVTLAPLDNGDAANPPMLIGVLVNHSVAYSGGGGEASRLILYVLERGAASTRIAAEVLNVPWSMSVIIRSCFTETDYAANAGSCHDEYRFAAQLAIHSRSPALRTGGDGGDGRDAGAAAPVLPTLAYSTIAEAAPRRTARNRDSSDSPRQRANDRGFTRDRRCSYNRLATYNSATKRYDFDRPIPECSDYTLP